MRDQSNVSRQTRLAAVAAERRGATVMDALRAMCVVSMSAAENRAAAEAENDRAGSPNSDVAEVDEAEAVVEAVVDTEADAVVEATAGAKKRSISPNGKTRCCSMH